MSLSVFIELHRDAILNEWDHFAETVYPELKFDPARRRDHANSIMDAIVKDMRAPQSNVEQAEKSKGTGSMRAGNIALKRAAFLHTVDRLTTGFDLLQITAEMRALRASVVHLWRDDGPAGESTLIAELTRFNEALDQLIVRSVDGYTKQVDRARNLFLATIGHDLRERLQAIAAIAREIQPPSDAGGDAQALGHQLDQHVVRMGRMIGELSEYTKIRLGSGVVVEPRRTNLRELCERLIAEFRDAQVGQRLRLEFDGDPVGEWDVDRVRKALTDLLNDAIAHAAPEEPVDVRLHGSPDDVVIAVRHRGPPRDSAALAQLFDPVSAHAKIGTLYLAREVARSHGGRLTVDLAVDATTFTLHLPRGPFRPTSVDPIVQASDIQER